MADTKRDEQEPSIEEILASIREIISDEEEVDPADLPSAAELSEQKPEKPAASPMSDDDISALFDEPAPAAPEPAPVAAKPAPAPAAPVVADEDDIIELTNEVPPSNPLDGINFDKPVQTVDFDEPEEEKPQAPEPEPEPESMDKDFDIDALFDTAADETPTPAPVFEEPAVAAPSPSYEPAESAADNHEALLNETAKSAAMGSLTKLAQNIAISRQPSGNTLEDVVRDMLRPMLKDWLDKNLPAIIERQVSRELEKLTKQAFRDE